MNLSVYDTLPNNIIAYWVSNNFVNIFKKAVALINYGEPKQGLATADNNRFLREWFEVDLNKECFNASDSINAVYTGKKWFPYNKGGEYRKWFGNQEFVINYYLDGKELKAFKKSVIRSPQFYFSESISWSKISGGNISFRYYPKGFLFDVAGCSLFIDDDSLRNYIFGIINTNLISYILNALSPTLNYEVGQISSIPIIRNEEKEKDVLKIVKSNIKTSSNDWNEFETSWNFKKHPLI